MIVVELTNEQRKAILSEHGKPLDVVDPATHEHYVLLTQEQYERVRPILEQGSEPAVTADIPDGILRSQQAYWRDLPQLLKQKNNQGKWVCYHGDECIGIGTSERELICECLRRGFSGESYYTDVIKPYSLAPWEVEEIEAGGHIVDDHDWPDELGEIGERI